MNHEKIIQSRPTDFIIRTPSNFLPEQVELFEKMGQAAVFLPHLMGYGSHLRNLYYGNGSGRTTVAIQDKTKPRSKTVLHHIGKRDKDDRDCGHLFEVCVTAQREPRRKALVIQEVFVESSTEDLSYTYKRCKDGRWILDVVVAKSGDQRAFLSIGPDGGLTVVGYDNAALAGDSGTHKIALVEKAKSLNVDLADLPSGTPGFSHIDFDKFGNGVGIAYYDRYGTPHTITLPREPQ